MTFKSKLAQAAICMAAFLAVPAQADISALYEVQPQHDEFEINFAMTVEVNEDGDARMHLTGRHSYMLVVDRETYLVSRGVDGIYAAKLADHETVLIESGQVGGIRTDLFNNFDYPEPRDVGRVQIGEWAGRGYSTYGMQDFDSRSANLVVSDDETLAPIGEAIAQTLGFRMGAVRSLSLVGMVAPILITNNTTRDLIVGGTPIRLGSLELARISNEDIDPDRFALPDRVLTLEELRIQATPFEWAPAFDRQPEG